MLQDYLRRLDAAARALPSGERQDLRARVWTDVAAAAGPAPTGDRLARVLGELGPPEGLVPARAGGGPGGLRDPAVVHLLGCSLLSAGITGVIGLVRVWRAPSWPRRDAFVATLVVLAGAVALPVLAPVHPVPGAVLGGLGAGAPLAGVLLGVVLLRARRQ
ncbi:hypothetical protein [Pseudonocardia sp. EC080610-09]|uniref:hypothetical protein n=1 Tax=Pseudonocardia sp. EC080610-09 TaxID=1688404 RepID=UPI0011AE739F|nr:hypothetical protein [Pseudonocardia sp. EC080610-09]